MMVWVSLLLAFSAFTTIAATMERHQGPLGTDTLGQRHLLLWRLGGYALLAISLLPCLGQWNTSVALATWVGLLAFSAGALGLMFTYFERHLRGLAWLAALLGMALWLVLP
jgi:hypothetical protein